jgi:hypothetical protein
MYFKTAKVKQTHFIHNILKSLFFSFGKYQSHIICSVTIKVPTFNQHDLEHTDVEQQSPQEQPRDYMSILTDTYKVGQQVLSKI